MKFENLIGQIHTTHSHLQQLAFRQTNLALTIRNWVIGYYLFEYEQKGEDRAGYGEKLYKRISDELKTKE